MDVHVSLAGTGDLSTRIYRQLREAILDGRLSRGERLPPTRDLARQLDVSRNTAATAYERLAAEGFLSARVGDGTYVSSDPVTGMEPRRAPSEAPLRPRSFWTAATATPATRPAPPAYDFRVGTPDVRSFPLAAWRRLVARALRTSSGLPLGYADPSGHEGLRAAIARHIGVSRAVRAGADDVIVTNGCQQALDLVGRVLVEPGSTVAVEEPGYPPARRLFASLGAQVTGVPVDTEGVVVDAIPRSARLIYVTPSHQFPLGTVMSLARRASLFEWAERRGAVVIEDDYDSEFRFTGRPLDPIQSLDRRGRVVYVGSFSKVMLPMLRLGFLVAPASLQHALRSARQLSDWHGEWPTQAALARFLDEGLLGRHIRKVAREYAARRARLIENLERTCRDWLQVVPSAAGLHVAARTRSGMPMTMSGVVRRAEAKGVAVHALSEFCAETPPEEGLVIGFGAIGLPDIDEGVRRLSASLGG